MYFCGTVSPSIRLILALLALLLGWLTPVHAVPPPVPAPIEIIAPVPDQAQPDVIIYLAAYRANGPPTAEGRAPVFFVVCATSGRSAWWNLYAYCGGDPVNRWDPSGLDYVDVANGEAFWVIEKDGWAYDPDVKRVKIGSVSGGMVNVDSDWGGGTADLAALKSFAGAFWNEYPDISGQSWNAQRSAIGGAIDRVRAGQSIMTGGALARYSGAAGTGLAVGAKATVNASANTASFGIYKGEAWDVSADDRVNGYDAAYMTSRISQEVLAGVAGGYIAKGAQAVGASCRVANGAATVYRTIDAGRNAGELVSGVGDMVITGEVNLANSLQVLGGAAGGLGNVADVTDGFKAICFVAGTQVRISGSTKSIEEVASGDQVWSRCEATGEQGLKSVVRTFISHPTELVHIKVESSDHEVVGTPEHPFWVKEAGWVTLGEVHLGDRLVCADGSVATVRSLQREHAAPGTTFTTYNFEVADWHTYFVQAGEGAVWVHNTCKQPMPRTLTKEARTLAPEDSGLTWVAENARMSPEALAYQSGATGARSGIAPALRYSDRSGLVRFDGLDGRVLIDRKLSFYSTPKARLALDRASMAVKQNPFYSLRIEVPNMAQYKRGMILLGEQGITNIRIGIVP